MSSRTPRTAVTSRRRGRRHQIFTRSSPDRLPCSLRPSVGWPGPADAGRARSLASAVLPLGGTDDSQEDRTGCRRARRAAGLGERRSAKPAAPAANGAAAPVQCSTKLLTLRPHYPDPVKPLAGAAGGLQWRRLDVRRPDHVDVGAGILEEGHERRLPGRSVPAAASRRSMPRRSTSARVTRRCSIRARRRQGRPDPPHPARARRGDGVLSRQGCRPGSQLGRRDDRQDLRRRDHELERPGHQEAQPKANLPDEAIAVVHRSDCSGTTAVFTTS